VGSSEYGTQTVSTLRLSEWSGHTTLPSSDPSSCTTDNVKVYIKTVEGHFSGEIGFL
jgi:hypothetical protein